MLSLSLLSRFPLGPSLCHGSLLRPGGRLSRLLHPGGRLSRLLRPGGHLSCLLRPGGRLSCLLRPGGRLSRLLRPGGCLSRLLRPGGRLSRMFRPGGRLSRLLRPGGRLSRLLRPGGRLSHLLRPGGRLSRLLRPGGRPTCQSHLTLPPTCQSHLTPPPTCQSHLTPPPTCQSHLTPPPTCQSHLTSQRSTQCPFTSLRFCPPCPGELLSHWPHMDLALRSLPRFHLRSTALLDYALCEASGSRPLGGGLCYESGCLSPHYYCTSPMDYNSHHSLHYNTHIPIHHSTNHTAVTSHSLALIVLPHLHLIHSPTYKQHTSLHTLRSLVLAPADISERYSSCYLSLCLTPDCPTLELWTCACDLDPCLVLFTSLLCLWYSCYCLLTIACLILPLSNKYYCTWIHTPLTSLYTQHIYSILFIYMCIIIIKQHVYLV